MSACIISPSEYVHTFYRPVSHAVRINMCLYQPVSYRRQNKHVPLPACRIAVGTCTCLYQPVSCRCQNMYVPLSACFMSLTEYVRAFTGLWYVAVSWHRNRWEQPQWHFIRSTENNENSSFIESLCLSPSLPLSLSPSLSICLVQCSLKCTSDSKSMTIAVTLGLKGPWTLILSRKYHLLCTI